MSFRAPSNKRLAKPSRTSGQRYSAGCNPGVQVWLPVEHCVVRGLQPLGCVLAGSVDHYRQYLRPSGSVQFAPASSSSAAEGVTKMLRLGTPVVGMIVVPSVAITVKEGVMAVTRREALAAAVAVGLALGGIGLGIGLSTNPVAVAQTETPKEAPVKKESPASPVATQKDGKPPHVVEKPDKKAGVDTFAHGPTKVLGKPTQECLLAESKLFMSRMPSGHGDVRFRDFFDPRYLKKHGLTDRDIAFEVIDNWPSFQGIYSIVVADDNQTALCILDTKEGKELFILRWVVYEGHIYISPEKAPDPKTGIFKPWILRTKVK